MVYNIVTVLLALWGLVSAALCFVQSLVPFLPAEDELYQVPAVKPCAGCGATNYLYAGAAKCSQCVTNADYETENE